jgi:SRSO17 transposase
VGGRDAWLIIDDTALPKKGRASVGVAPQYASARPLRGTIMAGAASTCPYEHDRVHLLASSSRQGSGSKKEHEPAAVANLASHQASDLDPAQPISSTNMPSLS